MRNRPRDRWNDADLAIAAQLARAQYAIERLLGEIDVEGDMIAGKVNPKHRLVETLSRRVMAQATLLHVHPEATQGRARDAGKKLAAEVDARNAEPDDLIPVLRAV